jgi:hypothetical protein
MLDFKSKIFTLSLKLSTLTFCFAFCAQFDFWEAYFHKIKSIELIMHLLNLNTTNDNVGLRASPHQLGCLMHAWELKIFVF